MSGLFAENASPVAQRGYFTKNASTCYLTSAYLCEKACVDGSFGGLSLQKACDGCGVGVSQRTPHRCRLTSAYLCEIACVDGRLGG